MTIAVELAKSFFEIAASRQPAASLSGADSRVPR
jgi:hypothetical protein